MMLMGGHDNVCFELSTSDAQPVEKLVIWPTGWICGWVGMYVVCRADSDIHAPPMIIIITWEID